MRVEEEAETLLKKKCKRDQISFILKLHVLKPTANNGP